MARILPDVLTDEDFPVHFGRYTLLGVLGEGGMARVFKAELSGPEGFKKKAAVKIVRSSVAADNQRLRASLINEARLGGLLHHPNIVDTYDFGEVDGLPFIAMEYVRGVGLERVIPLFDPLPPEIAIEIGIQMCAGLDHAHSLEDVDGDSELVHRDLKPSNVLLSRDGLVKVMDFGIAKASALSATNTATGTTKGTPSYMSPEQVEGDPLDRRSDLFAVGAILFELLTGNRLFEAGSLMSILMSVMQVEERLKRSGALDQLDMITLGLADVVRKCLRKEPEDRYNDAAELEHALKLIARQLPPPPPMKQWVRALMAGPGGLSLGESSVSTVPPLSTPDGAKPLTLRSGPSPIAPVAAPPVPPTRQQRAPVPPTRQQVAQAPPTPAPPVPVATTRPQQRAVTAGDVSAATGGQAVPPTRQQPIPRPPPATDPNASAGPSPKTGTLWIDDDEPPRRKGSPMLLLLLGLVLGGGFALVAALGALYVFSGDGEVTIADADSPPLLPELEITDGATEDSGPAAAATPRRTPRPRATPAPATEATPAAAETPEPTPEATPEATPEPTPEPTQQPVATATARPTRTPRPTPTPRATPRNTREGSAAADADPKEASDAERSERAEAPVTRLRFSGVKARVVGRDEEDNIKVRFQASLLGMCDNPRVTVSFNPPGARWVTKGMTLASGDLWLVNVPFKPKNHGKTYYWVGAKCDGGKSVQWGSADKPLKVDVK